MSTLKPIPITDGTPPPPADLSGPFADLFTAFYREVKAIRKHVSSSDLSVITTAARAAQGEDFARRLAHEAFVLGDADSYATHVKLAQSEARTKNAALSSLSLAGGLRGTAQKARLELAREEEFDPWADL